MNEEKEYQFLKNLKENVGTIEHVHSRKSSCYVSLQASALKVVIKSCCFSAKGRGSAVNG